MFIPPGLLSVAIVGRQARVEVLNRWKEITSVHCSSLPDQVDHKGGIVPVEVSVFCGPWLHSAGNRRSMPVPVLREHSSTDSHLPGRATLWMHLDANRSCFSDKNAPTYTTLGPSRRVGEWGAATHSTDTTPPPLFDPLSSLCWLQWCGGCGV